MVRVRPLRPGRFAKSLRAGWTCSIRAMFMLLTNGVPRLMGPGTPRVVFEAQNEIPRFVHDDEMNDSGSGPTCQVGRPRAAIVGIVRTWKVAVVVHNSWYTAICYDRLRVAG